MAITLISVPVLYISPPLHQGVLLILYARLSAFVSRPILFWLWYNGSLSGLCSDLSTHPVRRAISLCFQTPFCSCSGTMVEPTLHPDFALTCNQQSDRMLEDHQQDIQRLLARRLQEHGMACGGA